MSASSSTIVGDFPARLQRRRDQLFRRHVRQMPPVAVPPVKGILRTLGWRASASPMTRPFPGRTLSSPGASRPVPKSSSAPAPSAASLPASVGSPRYRRRSPEPPSAFRWRWAGVPRRNRRHYQRFIAAPGSADPPGAASAARLPAVRGRRQKVSARCPPLRAHHQPRASASGLPLSRLCFQVSSSNLRFNQIGDRYAGSLPADAAAWSATSVPAMPDRRLASCRSSGWPHSMKR